MPGRSWNLLSGYSIHYPVLDQRLLKESLIKSEWNFSNDRIAQFLLKNGANSHSIREIFKQKMGDSSFEKTAHDLFRASLKKNLNGFRLSSLYPVYLHAGLAGY